jgi:dihydrofolate synthase/folylpolyglutamate synthase
MAKPSKPIAGTSGKRRSPPPPPASPLTSPAEVELKPRSASGGLSSFDAAVDWLYQHVNFEAKPATGKDKHEYKLDRMHALCDVLDNPQHQFRSVHVAGTKGKGSTCEMVACILEACGYAAGLYTSPHLLDIRERVRINRRPVAEDAFIDLVRRLAAAEDKLKKSHGPCTFFELMTALGFLHFAEQAVDVGVIEVGLGGLLDCTNVITPEVAAVTTIGYDHTEILGDTLEQIAAQKAGIFKPGVPALAIHQDAKVLKVFRDAAATVGCPIQIVGEDIEFSARTEHQPGQGPVGRVNLTTDRHEFEHVPVPLRGEHQALNCGLALAVVDKLSERGFHVDEGHILKGLANVKLPGRFETVLQSPRTILDVAHNPDSIAALLKTIASAMQFDSLVVVFGCAKDKDAGAMLKSLAKAADKVVFTQADSPRATPAAELHRKYADLAGKMSQHTKSVPEALDLAFRAVGRGDVVCITGSFYICGEAKRWITDRLAARAATNPGPTPRR